MYPMTCVLYCEGKGKSWLKLLSPHWRRPYKTCSDVIRIVFSLLMSPLSGGLSRPPAVRLKVARTPWGRGLNANSKKCKHVLKNILQKVKSNFFANIYNIYHSPFFFPLTLFYTRGLVIVVLYVMVSQPYRFSHCFFKTLIALKLECFKVLLKFSLIHNKFLGIYAKN